MEWLNHFLRGDDALLVLVVVRLWVLFDTVLASHCVLHLHQIKVEVFFRILLGERATWLINYDRVVQLLTR